MTTKKQRTEVLYRLYEMGFSASEADQLRRISMTLTRWFEAECNGEIQREEISDTPMRYVNPGMSDRCYRIPDRERGAMRRLRSIMAEHVDLRFYVQGDPRGCSLYIGPSWMNGSNYSITGVPVY